MKKSTYSSDSSHMCGDESDGMELDTGQYITCKGAKYVVIDTIGHGGYGSVYKVRRDPPLPDEKEFAMKVERKKECREHSKLNMEVHLLKLMQAKKSKKNHFAHIFDKSKKEKFFMITMTLLGDSLSDLKRRRSPAVFSAGTTFGAGAQCLEGIEQLHKVGFIHRDIKPGNFAIGRYPRTHLIYILDFGIARKFVNESNDVKAPRSKVKFKGTVRFASLRCHKALELGRKDDCESWLYMLVDIGNEDGLPWQKEKDKKLVLRLKTEARSSEGRNRLFLPLGVEYMGAILTYIDKLGYADEVDYQFIYSIIKKAGGELKVDLNGLYDWEKGRVSYAEAPVVELPLSGSSK